MTSNFVVFEGASKSQAQVFPDSEINVKNL